MLFISREIYMLRMFVNRVLGNVFGPKVEDIIENWRTMHGEVLHNFYCLLNIRIFRSMMLGWTWHVAGRWESRNSYIILAAKRDGNIPPRRAERRWDNNIKTFFK